MFVQLSEGGAPYTALVPLALSGNKIEFTLPPGDVYDGMRFAGTISNTEIHLNTPSRQVETLHRGKIYWQERVVEAAKLQGLTLQLTADTKWIEVPQGVRENVLLSCR